MKNPSHFFYIFEILLINDQVIYGTTNDLGFLFEILYPFRNQYVQLLWGMRLE